MNTSYILDSPFYVFYKKHYCLQCNQLLDVRKVNKVVNSKSLEAKNFDFACGDSSLYGDVKFFYHMFFCIKCEKYFSIKEVKDNERYLRYSKKFIGSSHSEITKKINNDIIKKKVLSYIITFVVMALIFLFLKDIKFL